MLYATAMLFQLGIIASVVLGMACAVRRILIAYRDRGVSAV